MAVPKSLTITSRIMGPLELTKDRPLFVDDSSKNVTAVNRTVKCATMFVAGPGGLNREECDAIRDWAFNGTIPSNGLAP